MPKTQPRPAGFGATTESVTPTGTDPCPECGDLNYIHPREFSPDDLSGYCSKCKRWMEPTEGTG